LNGRKLKQTLQRKRTLGLPLVYDMHGFGESLSVIILIEIFKSVNASVLVSAKAFSQ
jgi:hypothetical protein